MSTTSPALLATPATSDRQLPVLEGYAKVFYGFCQQHDLRFQRCSQCGTWRHPPRPMCNQCHSVETEWAQVRGLGTVHCWTVPMTSIGGAFASDIPYVAAIVELDEGPRMATWVTGIAPGDLRNGLRVTVWFDQVTPSVTLAKFNPA
ncbi:MAG: hypothetical protein EON92_15515 [Burkholderiales bacterium]|nr:MAG: hypothetical protein EON92_15515 [Burkholderiales bacterium]